MLTLEIIMTIMISLVTITSVIATIAKAIDMCISPLDVVLHILFVLVELSVGGAIIYGIWYFIPKFLSM